MRRRIEHEREEDTRREAHYNHLHVLQLSVYLQQLRLASPVLSLLASSRLPSSPLLLPFSFPSLLTPGGAQSADPLAHIDSQELRASWGGGASAVCGAGGERGRRREDKSPSQGLRALGGGDTKRD